MKAREFLAQKVGDGLQLRNVLKEKLSADELRALAKQVGGAEQLVAPKRRGEATGLAGEALIAWLAEDGARLRRPIVIVGQGAAATVTLGFAGDAKAQLIALLGP